MVHYYQGIQSTFPDVELWVGNELRSWTTFDAWLPEFQQGDIWTPMTFSVNQGEIIALEVQTLSEYP